MKCEQSVLHSLGNVVRHSPAVDPRMSLKGNVSFLRKVEFCLPVSSRLGPICRGESPGCKSQNRQFYNVRSDSLDCEWFVKPCQTLGT